MADTLPNIILVAGQWIDLYAESGIDVGTQIIVENIGSSDIYLAIQATKPLVGHAAYNIVKRNGDPVQNNMGDAGAWAYSNSVDGLINVIDVSGFTKIQPELLPRTAFGEVSVSEHTPITQITAAYGVPEKVESFSVLGGTTGAENSLFFATSGITPLALSAVLTRRQVTYRAGQGLLSRLTAIFDTPVAGSSQVSGLINNTDILGFGFEGEIFGIIYRHDGASDIHELTITVPAAASENATITIDTIPYTVPLTAGTVQHNAFEIANSLNAQVPNYDFTSNNDQVVSRSFLAFVGNGFAFSSPTAVASWIEVQQGILPINDFIPQTEWNLDKRSDLDPLLGNVYQIKLQYLGFGGIEFSIEDKQNSQLVPVHVIRYANTNLTPSVGNPTFRVGWLVNNGPLAQSLTIKGASAAGFVEGKIVITEASRAYRATNIAVPVVNDINIVTFRNRIVFGKRRNRVEAFGLSLTAGTDSAKAAIISIKTGATVSGDLDFQYIDKDHSVMEVATDAGIVTGGRLISSFIIPPAGGDPFNLEELASLILPDEIITVSAQITAAAASEVSVTVIWVEDL